MTAPRILVVDDEPNIRDLLSTGLSFAGFQVKTVANGAATISAVLEEEPDLIILDVMLPDMNGFSVTKRLRGAGFTAPILFLTAKDGTDDKIEGLNAGGDDYVTKPFSLEEVIARLRTILRRAGKVSETERSSRITFADLELDEDTHEVFKAGKPVSLSPTEFTLLRYFMLNAGTVLSKPRILEHVWNYDFGGEVGVVESYVSYLRRKVDIGDVPLIHTVRGVGYVMREPRT